MSMLEKLIQKLCPNGVEYKPLWCLTAWDKRFNSVDRAKQPTVITYHYFLANELTALAVANGTVKLLTTNSSNIFTTEALAGNKISKGEIVALPWGGNPNIQYYKGKFLTADNRIATSLDTGILDTKFLYYVLLSRTEEIGSYYRGSGIKHPDMSKVLAMKIPIPPIPVQKEIVRMLDDMAGLIDALEEELAAHKKQYEWCRERLLKTDDAEIVSLGEICDYSTKRISASSLNTHTYICVESMLQDKCGKVDAASVPEFGNLIAYEKGDVLIGNIRPYLKKIWLADVDGGTNGDVLVVQRKDKNLIAAEYLYYVLSSDEFFLYDMQYAKGAKMPRGDKAAIMKYSVPVPSFTVQKEVVRMLDEVAALIEALENEMALRKQQYEYYRDKLLAFKRKPEVA